MTATYVYFIWYLVAKDSLDERHKFIGIFGDRTSKEEAAMTIRQLELKPGFCDLPRTFHIRKIIIGKLNWKSGFNLQDTKDEIFEIQDES